MNEKTLNRPLSGEEIIEAIGQKIKQQLQRNCHLAPHLAYGAFAFEAAISIKFQEAGLRTQGTGASVRAEEGEFSPDMPVEGEQLVVTAAEAPPNQVRIETGQGVPVLTTDAAGKPVEKKITYKDPKWQKAGHAVKEMKAAKAE